MLYTGKPTEVINNYDPENTTVILAKSPDSSNTLTIFTNNVIAVFEIMRTLKQEDRYTNVRTRPLNKVRWLKSTTYDVVEYDMLANVHEYNAAERLRDMHQTAFYVQSIHHWHGTYRQQNIVRVYVIEDNRPVDVTSTVHEASTLPYNYKHNGIHVDSSDYKNEIRLQLHRVLGRTFEVKEM